MDHLTLFERVQRLENILVETGIAGDRNTISDFGPRGLYNIYRSGGEAADKVAQHTDQAQMQDKIETSAFGEIIARISNCNDRVCLTADKLQKIGDRIMGELPTNTEETSDIQRSPDGTLEHTFMALNWLDASLSRLEQVALRMERV